MSCWWACNAKLLADCGICAMFDFRLGSHESHQVGPDSKPCSLCQRDSYLLSTTRFFCSTWQVERRASFVIRIALGGTRMRIVKEDICWYPLGECSGFFWGASWSFFDAPHTSPDPKRGPKSEFFVLGTMSGHTCQNLSVQHAHFCPVLQLCGRAGIAEWLKGMVALIHVSLELTPGVCPQKGGPARKSGPKMWNPCVSKLTAPCSTKIALIAVWYGAGFWATLRRLVQGTLRSAGGTPLLSRSLPTQKHKLWQALRAGVTVCLNVRTSQKKWGNGSRN